MHEEVTVLEKLDNWVADSRATPKLRSLTALACTVAALLSSFEAMARPLDLHLERLASLATDPDGRVRDGQYKHLMQELTLALGPRTSGPAASLGPLGIEAAYEIGVSGVNATADYWKKAVDEPQSSLTAHSIHVRKGLPLSTQLGTSFTALQGTSLVAIGMELNFAVIDGFKHVPDVSLGFGGNTVLGWPANSSVDYAVLGWGATISKSFGIAGLFALQPWVSYRGTATYVSTHQLSVNVHPGQLTGSEFSLPAAINFTDNKALDQNGAIGLRFVVMRMQFGGEFMRSFTQDLNLVTGKVGVAF